MKEIQLNKFKPNSHSNAPKFAQVDDEDYEYLNQFNWCCIKGGHTFYATTTIVQSCGKRMMTQMHRLVMKVADKTIFIDHKDHNGCNNQKLNLRESNYSQNNSNRVAQKSSTSKYIGVSWHPYKRKRKDGSYLHYGYWEAVLAKHKTHYRLGLFHNEIDAAKAYDKKAKEMHGEFANLNFPTEI